MRYEVTAMFLNEPNQLRELIDAAGGQLVGKINPPELIKFRKKIGGPEKGFSIPDNLRAHFERERRQVLEMTVDQFIDHWWWHMDNPDEEAKLYEEYLLETQEWLSRTRGLIDFYLEANERLLLFSGFDVEWKLYRYFVEVR
jgi:hypothetical protein